MTFLDIFRLSLLMSSLKMIENETPVRHLLSRDRRFVVEVLSMELIDGRWNPNRTGVIDFLSGFLSGLPRSKVRHEILMTFRNDFHPLHVSLGGRRFLLSLIVQLRLGLQRETYLCQLTKVGFNIYRILRRFGCILPSLYS